MPAHGLERTRGVRYVRDTGDFELWCPDCDTKGRQSFWPITLEFWNPNLSLQRCRACWASKKRADERARRAANPEHKAQENRAWARANRDVINLKRRARRREAAVTRAALGVPA